MTTSFVDSQPPRRTSRDSTASLSDVSFDASRDEWLALLSRASDQPTDQTDPTDPADPAVSADDADSAARARSGATLCAVGVFDHVDDLVGLTSVAAYDPHPTSIPPPITPPPLSRGSATSSSAAIIADAASPTCVSALPSIASRPAPSRGWTPRTWPCVSTNAPGSFPSVASSVGPSAATKPFARDAHAARGTSPRRPAIGFA